MKKFYKITALILIICISLTGCVSNGNNSQNPPEDQTVIGLDIDKFYEYAKNNGYEGNLGEFKSLILTDNAYDLAVAAGFSGSKTEWLMTFVITGEDKEAPSIGSNGNWFIGSHDTGVPAQGTDGENGTNGITPHIGTNGNWFIGDADTNIKAQGTNGTNGVTPHIGLNGNWFIGDTDTNIKAQGTNGTNGITPHIGASGNWFIGDTDTGIKAGLTNDTLYVLYKKTFGYEGSEQEWLTELLKGTLDRFESSIDNVPDLFFHVFTGEDFNLPEKVLTYLANGQQILSDIKWDRASVDTGFAGTKNIFGKIDKYPHFIKCVVQVEAYTAQTNTITGSINGFLNNEKALVTLYNATSSQSAESDSRGFYRFTNITEGKYNVKVDTGGYHVSEPVSVSVSPVKTEKYTNIDHANFEVRLLPDNAFYYLWQTDEYYFGNEVSSNVNSKVHVDFLDEDIYISDTSASVKLFDNFNILLSDQNQQWGSEQASRLLDVIESIPMMSSVLVQSVWTLTDDYINNDINIEDCSTYKKITVSAAAFKYSVPRTAEIDGVKGKFFSNRLYNAAVRFCAGDDIVKIDYILKTRFGCSVLVGDYAALTAGITDETSEVFQQFTVEELFVILNMFEEMPRGYHVIQGLSYLVRRKNGLQHPLYPDAPAVAWVKSSNGYIEFMESAFTSFSSDHMYRLIIHEKAHFMWGNLFSNSLKEQWIATGGWYEDPGAPEGWSTTKTTEFVTAYAHLKNPDEDMAESVSYYIVNPDKLKAVSAAKYEFIQKYIMHGDIYLSEIREDLTFEVFNLYPDYDYPGKITKVEISVQGDVFDDKTVTVKINLNDADGVFDGAIRAYMRLHSSVDTYYDMYVYPVDEGGHILQGSLIVSKHAKSGYWTANQIVITDKAGNQRFEGFRDFGWKLYIDNPAEIITLPKIVPETIEIKLFDETYTQGANTYNYQRLEISFEADTVYLPQNNSALIRLAYLDDPDTYSVESWGYFDAKTQRCYINFNITEFYRSGTYQIRLIVIRDLAENRARYFYYDEILKNETLTFTINTSNPDTQGPELDINRISIAATPVNPAAPDGETLVTIKYYAKDNLSGLGLVSYSLRDPQGIRHFEYHYHENFRTMYFEGDPVIWTQYTLVIILPKGSAPGIWGLLEMTLVDKALNKTYYNFSEIIHFTVD